MYQMSQLIMYTKNDCSQCKGAKMFLDSKGLDYESRNIDENPDYADEVRALGLRAMPVIVAEGTSVLPFTGFQPQKLTQIAKELLA